MQEIAVGIERKKVSSRRLARRILYRHKTSRRGNNRLVLDIEIVVNQCSMNLDVRNGGGHSIALLMSELDYRGII